MAPPAPQEITASPRRRAPDAPLAARAGTRRAWRSHLLVLAAYLLATLVFTWPLAINFTTAIPGDSFDGWQNYWNLWWVKSALVDRLMSPLFTDILYAPTGVGLYFHTLNPFNGLVTLPVQLTAGLIAAYNTAVILAWVLGGYGMFLLARWVTSHRPVRNPRCAADDGWQGYAGPLLAGLVYTLSPFHMAHLLGHMQVFSLQWIPFYILYLLRAQRAATAGRPWLRSALSAGLFLALNGLCDWYFVLYLMLFTGLAVVWQWWGDIVPGAGTAAAGGALRLYRLWAAVRPALVAGVVFAVLLSPWLIPMVQETRQFQFMVRPPTDLYIFSASVTDFLVPNRLHTLLRPESFAWIGNQVAPISERTISVGYVALGLAVAALWVARRKAAFWWVAALFFLAVALGPQWHFGNITAADIPAAAMQGQGVPGGTPPSWTPASWTPYGLLNQYVPFMRISRSVSRFALMVQVSMAVLAALGLHGWLARLGAARRDEWRDATTDAHEGVRTGQRDERRDKRRDAATDAHEGVRTGRRRDTAPGDGVTDALGFGRTGQRDERRDAATDAHEGVRTGQRGGGQRGGGQRGGGQGLAAAITGVLIVLLLAEYWVAPYPLSPPDTPGWYTQLAQDPDPRAVLNLPMNYDRPGYLLYQTVHHKPLTVAYISRDDPRTLTERVPLLQHLRHLGPDILAVDPVQVGPTVLADLGVGTVVLDRYKMPGGLEREYTDSLAGKLFAGQEPVYSDERITAYTVATPAQPVPYLRLGALHWGPYRLENGQPARTLTGGPAAVEIVHATGQDARLRITYRTQPPAGNTAAGATADGAVATARGLDGRTLGVLPAAPQGGSVTVAVPAPTAEAGGFAGLTLEPVTPGTVVVTEIALE